MKNQKYTDTELEEALVICNRKYPKKDHIPQKAVVILKDGRVVKIGNWGSNIKTGNTHSSKEIKAILDKLFPNQLTYQRHFYTDQEIKEAIKKYKEENPTLQWIDSSAVVILDNGKKVLLGAYGQRIKNGVKKISEEMKAYILSYFPNLFEGKKPFLAQQKDSLLKEALKAYKEGHPKANRIPLKAIVILKDGRKVRIGSFAANVKNGSTKASPEIYNLLLSLYPHHFDKQRGSVNSYVVQQVMRKERNKYDFWTVEHVLKKFGLRKEALDQILSKIKIESPKDFSKQEQTKVLISTYCNSQGYDYEKLKKAFQLHNFCKQDTLEQLINRVITKLPNEISTWIYEKYGSLVAEKLTYLKLDAKAILKYMSDNIVSIEEGIQHEVLEEEKQTEGNNWLEDPYNCFIKKKQKEENVLEEITEFKEAYPLNELESQVLTKSIRRYFQLLGEYRILDVGLTVDQKEKIAKIKKYQMNEENIEESFFVPLFFDQGVLLGKQKKLYQRREVLRQYIIDWNYYTEEEKELLTTTFTKEELHYMDQSRKEIDQVIKKTKTKSYKR